jgi:hypothetical protein
VQTVFFVIVCFTLFLFNGQNTLTDLNQNHVSKHSEPFVLPSNFNENLEEKTGYGPRTGEWFLSPKGGYIGFTISAGIKEPESEVNVNLNDSPTDRNIRFRLSKLDKTFRPIFIVDEKIVSSTNVSKRINYSSYLLKEQDTLYLLSAEVLDANQKVEDVLLSVIYVPKIEISANLSIDKQQYAPQDGLVLHIQNQGPTTIFFGLPYKLEKYESGEWREISLHIAFNDIGLTLEPGKVYEQTIQLNEIGTGKYRISKEVSVFGIDKIHRTLGEEFDVVSE